MIDERLREWATPRQVEVLDALNECGGSTHKAAKKLGVSPSTVRSAVAGLKSRAARQGWSPDHDMVRPAPEPFVVKGVSTLYDGDGNVRAQWVKTKLDQELALEAVREYVRWLTEGVEGKSPGVSAPSRSNSDLVAVYPMGDPHFGMYAWAEESGDDFDLDIAERLTRAAIDRLVETAPAAKTGVVLNLGDFFHADNNKAVTPESGHSLDTDTRWAKVMQVGLRAMTHVVLKALEKHEKVVVRNVRGNHDPHSSFALSLAMDAFFSNNSRVKVDLSASPFWYYRFGKTLVAATHGDTCKMDKLAGVMAADRPEDWGQTKFRYWYVGHVHHSSVKEYPGVTCESFRTLAAKDAWHAGAGYRSGRDMRLIVHHRSYGEVERHRCDVAEIS